MNKAYLSLERHFARLSSLNDAIGILCWDKEVIMPSGAAERRAENLAMLEGLRHEILTAPVVAELLEQAEPGDDVWRRANLEEMRRLHAHATALPGELVEASTQATARCEMVWRTARENGDFAAILPTLSEVLRLTREVAFATGEKLGLSPYDALLDTFDPGTRQTDIDPVFTQLAAGLPELIGTVLEKQNSLPAATPLPGPFSVPRQEALGRQLMQQLGFDVTRGRLDVSTHPFCGGATHDVRLTTRYDENDFIPAMMGVLHETGHALYDMGLPPAWLSQPVGQAGGMTLHESQSLLMEMQVCRSNAFAGWLAPKLQAAFDVPTTTAGWDAQNIHRLLTHVQPGFIRVDADEVTYPAHILVRYELEKALISGDLPLADLPTAFNERIHALLGLHVPDDGRGCLQDIHWPEGLFGYFPCYTLGALTAAQLREAACKQVPQIMPAIAKGDFTPLLGWLRENVHSRARSASMPQIVQDATGRKLDASAYLAHIQRRYVERAEDA
ncbi:MULTISPECIES: carboxypeptidase M32 [Acetobacter]|uniref:Metal-dependent carboxypeptidase n=1 Tax=Acetobacter pomorum DM001 TaxID=945681 RepID=F1YTU6_9PROT|nr:MULTISPECIES: carboxypeptidase M32 [Acetobacter]ATI13074.1 carboxypeptidase M32 [Acetobacter pomorum]AXC26811.1 carboxypeptidase M32 [Acetobacter sp. JWB]EGE47811.1 Thermostable carboxypeptidase 1 [Acetobacter pomorum DM001]KAA8429206.1 carboxypeptidase M32 [Acetobacter pomorum]KAA8436280.1 carboxypeptidase M32 [Acetobacter pomorum]